MPLGLFKCGISWLDISVVIQLCDPDMPQSGDLEFLAEEAPETPGHLSWASGVFAGTLAQSILTKSNSFNLGNLSYIQLKFPLGMQTNFNNPSSGRGIYN